MNDIRFSSDQNDEFGRPAGRRGFNLGGMLIRWGIAKNRQQAEYVMLGIVALVFVAIFFLLWGSGSPEIPPPPSPDGIVSQLSPTSHEA